MTVYLTSMRAAVPLRGVLIDLWGTLLPVASKAHRTPHLLAMGEILGIDPAQFERNWSETLRDRTVGGLGNLEATIRAIAELQGTNPTEASVRRALDVRLAYTRTLFDACKPLLPAIDKLKGAGLRLAVVSDCSGEIPRLWPSTDLGARIQSTVFSCETGFCKPDPRAFRLALRQLSLDANDCAYVGDGDSRELTGASSMGLRAFLFRHPSQAALPEYRAVPDSEWNGPTLASLEKLLVP